MITKDLKTILSLLFSFALITTSLQVMYRYQASASVPEASTGNGTEAAPMSASELQALVAPIALYPDAIVAQILSAATFPDQVAIADYWLQQNKNLTGNALMQAVDKQSWDPSVKALTEFPSVLDNMAKNLTWTSSLGEAYHNQTSDVMTAVQTLRAKAKAAGNLKSTPQITVVQQTPQTIVIEPANPQIVYVPEYNPAVIYGTPYVTPGYTAEYVAAASVLSFGVGIAVGALMSGGGCCSWGYSSWNCNWHGGTVVYNNNNFYGNSAWHGGYYNGGYHNGYGYNNAYNRTTNINRNVNTTTNNFNANRFSGSNSWAHNYSGLGSSTAFSGLGGHFGGSSGWSSRAESGRGWGSMFASSFGGGRFGGGGFGGGRFGGGGFHGGGFRR